MGNSSRFNNLDDDIQPSDIRPTNDLAFKFMLGDEKHTDSLIYFLNCAKVSADPVVGVTIMNSEMTAENIIEKGFRIDIRAKTDKGEIMIIEMQCARDSHMVARLMDYGCRNVANQLGKGEYYGALKRVVCIAVLNFKMFPEDNRFWRTVSMRDNETKELVTDVLELQFLELPKTDIVDENNPLTYWVEFLKNPYSEETEKICKKVPQIEEARKMYEKSIADPEKFEMIKSRERALWEYQGAISEAEERGIVIGEERGIVIGEERGAYNKAIENARSMLRDNMPMDLIVRYSGLSLSEVQSLRVQ